MRIRVIVFLIFVLLVGSITYIELQEFQESLDICQELGYFGVRFVDKPLSTEVECANQTDLEQIKEAEQ